MKGFLFFFSVNRFVFELKRFSKKHYTFGFFVQFFMDIIILNISKEEKNDVLKLIFLVYIKCKFDFKRMFIKS